jgi:hypothetical protein
MDLRNYPPESEEKLVPERGFPQQILYKTRDDGVKEYRGFHVCGCFLIFTDALEPHSWKEPCTVHQGTAPCFFSKDEQHALLHAELLHCNRWRRAAAKSMVEFTVKEKEVQQRLDALNRDRSPERK